MEPLYGAFRSKPTRAELETGAVLTAVPPANRHEMKRRFTGLLQSPLTDSNRRPPPYHEREEGVDSCGLRLLVRVCVCRQWPRLVAFCIAVRPWCDPAPLGLSVASEGGARRVRRARLC